MSAARHRVGAALEDAAARVVDGLAGAEFRARLSVPLTQALIELLEHRRTSRARRADPARSPTSPPGLAAGAIFAAHPNVRPARRPEHRPRARTPRLRYAIVVGAGVLCVGGAATASSLWLAPAGNPVYGFNPGLSSSAPPTAQLGALGVLRRPQTDADRGAYVQGALADVNNFTRGLRSDYVRVLERTAAGPVVLVPVQTRDGTKAGPVVEPAIGDALCVYYPIAASNSLYSSTHCWTTAQLLTGGAFAGIGDHEYGLVPDGVRSVRVALGTWQRSVAVAGNFFDVTLPVGDGSSAAANGVPISPSVTFSRAAD
jgi:hypothetical protein